MSEFNRKKGRFIFQRLIFAWRDRDEKTGSIGYFIDMMEINYGYLNPRI